MVGDYHLGGVALKAIWILLCGCCVSVAGSLTLTNSSGAAINGFAVTNISGIVSEWSQSVPPGGVVSLEMLPWGQGSLGAFRSSGDIWLNGVDFSALSTGSWSGAVEPAGVSYRRIPDSDNLFGSLLLGLGFGSVAVSYTHLTLPTSDLV